MTKKKCKFVFICCKYVHVKICTEVHSTSRQAFTHHLWSIGYTQSKSDHCLFLRATNTAVVALLFVDDEILAHKACEKYVRKRVAPSKGCHWPIDLLTNIVLRYNTDGEVRDGSPHQELVATLVRGETPT